jgi:hypothetical protein
MERTMASTSRGHAVIIAALLAALAAAGTSARAQADSVSSGAYGLLNDKWVANVGGFFFTTDMRANLNGQSSTHPEVDFDETFGKAGDSRRVRADALWRITPEHHVRFMYFDNSRVRSRVLDKDLEWGDYTFQLGARTEFTERTRVVQFAYEYAFWRRPTYEVAASVGVHYIRVDLQLSGIATFTDSAGNTTTASATTQANSLPAPLPVVGLRGGWVLNRDWYLDAQGQVFKTKSGAFDGHWSDLRVGLTWMFHRNFGLGLGYNRFTTKLDVDKDDFDGRLKTGYSGLQAYLTGTF